MAASRYPFFSRQGWLPLLLVSICAGVIWHYTGQFFWLLPFAILGVLLIYMFRDPDRDIPSVPLAVVSPVDGRVSGIEHLQDPYLDRPSLRVQIDMFRTGVYATRSPVEGKILESRPAKIKTEENAPHGVWIKTDEDDDVVLVMSRGPMGNAPRCFFQFGERVGQGQRCGYLHLGGRIHVYLAENSRVVVNINDQLLAGKDVIAHLVHK